MNTDYFLVLDTSIIINGLVGCKDREIETACRSIIKIIENRERTIIEAYISEKVKKETINILGAGYEMIIDSLFSIVEVDDSTYMKNFKGAESSMIPVANEIGKRYRRPVLLSDDVAFVNKYHRIGYQHRLFTSKQFLLEFVPSFACFRESCSAK